MFVLVYGEFIFDNIGCYLRFLFYFFEEVFVGFVIIVNSYIKIGFEVYTLCEVLVDGVWYGIDIG